MNDHNPLVSIIIVNYNGRKYLKECLDSLLNQMHRYFEIILVDNKSSDDSLDFVKRNFPDIKIIKNETNLGFAYACNIGIKASRGSLICLFNQDAIADKEWLSTLVYAIQTSENIAATAGRVYFLGNTYGNNVTYCTWSKIDPYTAYSYNFNKGDEPMSNVDYLDGAAILVKREVIEKIGFLDPEYFHYFDVTDWCARMIRASYDLLYVPQAIVWHVVSASISDSNLLYYMNRNRMRFALKNFDWDYLAIYFALYAVESVYELGSALRRGNFLTIAKVRANSLIWNVLHLRHTIVLRKTDFKLLKNSGRSIRSYNRSLPLKEYKIGRLEQLEKYLKKIWIWKKVTIEYDQEIEEIRKRKKMTEQYDQEIEEIEYKYVNTADPGYREALNRLEVLITHPLETHQQGRINYLIAYCLTNSGRYREALDRLEVLTTHPLDSPQQGRINYLIAYCLHSMKIDLKRALYNYNLALENGYQEFWVLYNRGALYKELGDIEAARVDLDRAVSLNPEHEGAKQVRDELRQGS